MSTSDSSFNIWVADQIIPIRVPEKYTELGQEKFDNCEYRSIEKIKKSKRGCCSSTIEEGFECSSLNLFPVFQTNCENCPKYKKKE